MDKVSVLNQIRITLEGLLSQTQQLEKGGQPIHQIDKDLLLEKTRALYEQMMALENTREEEKMPGPAPTPNEEIPAIAEITKTVVEEKEVVAETTTGESYEMPEAKAEETVPEITGKPGAEEIPIMEGRVEEPVEELQEHAEPPETAFDLFSVAQPETLGEILKSSEKPVVADSLQKSGINDLREAIGINDKFLFVNELFNGDLERYNKVIDELNDFSRLSGAQTYLTELQVQYQWVENSQSYQKLNTLLERKFA